MRHVCILLFAALGIIGCGEDSTSMKQAVDGVEPAEEQSVTPQCSVSVEVEDMPSIQEPVDTCRLWPEPEFSSYVGLKEHCESIRATMHARYLSLTAEQQPTFLDSVGRVYGRLIAKHFMPFWLTTGWTFDGHTDEPQQGTVACGYLISTQLRHSGVNIDRYKLAQQPASNGAKSLLGTSDVPGFIGPDHIFQKLSALPDGLYKVGLSFHVGWLWIEAGTPYFMHSNYIAYEGVIIENAHCSEAFNASTIFQIVPISSNNFLMKRWLSGEEIEVVTS